MKWIGVLIEKVQFWELSRGRATMPHKRVHGPCEMVRMTRDAGSIPVSVLPVSRFMVFLGSYLSDEGRNSFSEWSFYI